MYLCGNAGKLAVGAKGVLTLEDDSEAMELHKLKDNYFDGGRMPSE